MSDRDESPVPSPGSLTGDSVHVTVMPEEVARYLGEISPEVLIDGTFGGGGHAARLLPLLSPAGRLIGIDRDPAVLQRVEREPHDQRLTVFLGSYEKAPRALEAVGCDAADGMVLDLGLSSDQLADRSRGFSFQGPGELDLRFDPETGTPAHQWLARHSEKEIADVIYAYGEERFRRRIAREIVARARDHRPVRTVEDLVEICCRCVPRAKHHDIHPATRTFQALRIAVNDELGGLRRTLEAAPEWIRPGGRIAVISFHSLEDRIVKQSFREDPRWQVLTPKPLRPGEAEAVANPRSRSAKLRVAERV